MSFKVIVKKSPSGQNGYDNEFTLPDKQMLTLIDFLAEHCLDRMMHRPRPGITIRIDPTEIPLLREEAEQHTMWVRVSNLEKKQIKRMAKMIGISMSYYMRCLHRGVVRAYLASQENKQI